MGTLMNMNYLNKLRAAINNDADRPDGLDTDFWRLFQVDRSPAW